jgi:carboxyl-terminal processing protease
MTNRDPEKNFEALWKTFHRRYPFFELRKVDWKAQYDTYRPKVTKETGDEELFDILCQMIDPLDDGHVELEARIGGKKRRFAAEKKTRFQREFTDREVKQLFKTSEKTLVANGFGRPKRTEANILRYARSKSFGYLRIVELEGINKRKLTAALDRIARDFDSLEGFIIDIRDCPGGEDSIAIMIINRFCDRNRVAFHRRTKIGPGKDDFTP